VIEMLDSGGQAQVFRVHHPELAKDFVLKLAMRPVAPGDAEHARLPAHGRVGEEGRLLAQYEHPSLVRVVDLDVHEGRPFVVMDYVPGLTLEQFVELHRPAPRRAARLAAEVAQVVAYLHDRGVVHQDIKPRNVLIDTQGRPRLIDFGLARRKHAWSDEIADWSGGTAAYMSPEQAAGCADRIGPRTDIFGMGGLLYYLLTGRPLYQGASRISMMRQALNAEYLAVRQVNPRVPRGLERICHKALAADPERRHRTAVELEHALRGFLARRRIAAGLVGTAILAAGLLASRSQPQSPQADRAATPAPAVVAPLKIVAFDVEQWRGKPGEPLGSIRGSDRPILADDELGLSADLDAAAYGYLIALNSNGEDQLCYPTEESDRPSSSTKVSLGPSEHFFLTDGPGLQAFVVVASSKPLPPFAEWDGRDDLHRRWSHLAPDGISGAWEYKDGKTSLISSVPRGEIRRGSERGAPAMFQAVCDDLAKRYDVEAVRAIAFPVKPKS
jgi:serine/threonine protein kinase